MCQNPPIAWAMIQTLRSIVREGELSPKGRLALSQHRLEALAHYLPPLVDLLRADEIQNSYLETDVEALPTVLERCLLNAMACALRDPERSRRLLEQCLAPSTVSRAEDLVTAMACELEERSCQRHRQIGVARVAPPAWHH